jgi:RNA polymerase sigma-70 factor (ECF subfamily)
MEPPSTHLSLLAAMLDGPGRDRAWETFEARYAPLLGAWCARRGLRGADADDLSQDILLKLFTRLPSYDRTRGRFRDWLAALVRNAALDWLRARQRRPGDQGIGGGDVALDGLCDPSGPDELALALEGGIGQEVAHLVEQVRARARDSWPAFAGHILEGRPAEEVARELGKSVGAVYQACSRVKAMLAELNPTLGGGRKDQAEGPT